MASVNKRKVSTSNYTAGGLGGKAAKESYRDQLKRLVCSCLLGEDLFYIDGKSVMDNIHEVMLKASNEDCIDIMRMAKNECHLRHAPLYMLIVLAEKKALTKELVYEMITRTDDITELLALYLKDGKKPLPKQMEKGIALSFKKFDEYQLAKYKAEKKTISLRDAMILTHPKAETKEQNELYSKLMNKSLATPYTWETELSAGKDKKETWTNLINSGKIGGLAMLRNIRNMMSAGVDKNVISKGIKDIHNSRLLPLNYLKAATINDEFSRDIEDSMLESYKNLPKLTGNTLFIIDVSGSMESAMSSRSSFTRYDAACTMAMLAANQCENFYLVATAGNDAECKCASEYIQYPKKGFDITKQIHATNGNIGGGGIFTRQCLEWCKNKFKDVNFDRIIVFSDSQDCDRKNSVPNPFGKYNYICDVSSEKYGINYSGKWTAEISGFSEYFLTYIASMEGIQNTFSQN
jgi:60 kDa SS-A/Ro ribonucleoprotein